MCYMATGSYSLIEKRRKKIVVAAKLCACAMPWHQHASRNLAQQKEKKERNNCNKFVERTMLFCLWFEQRFLHKN